MVTEMKTKGMATICKDPQLGGEPKLISRLMCVGSEEVRQGEEHKPHRNHIASGQSAHRLTRYTALRASSANPPPERDSPAMVAV